ncbi:T9SS type A sorting domain-containing protein [Gracilimonas sp. BCB1]|uniref:T9SS type A sorting domain-containing protein n=1 Tax=Gracilimonas sp. BCB1 TaxID=3152362 RepID=UPI0032D8F31D
MMKTNKIIALLSLVLIPMMASAQWTQDTTFKATDGDSFFENHGVAVDGQGRVWIQSYYWVTEDLITQRDLGDDGVPDTISTGAIYVYNQDGTPADFSPLIDIEYEDESTPADTLYRRWNGESYEAMSGRGIEADYNGDIIISSFDRLIKISHESVKAVAKVVVNGSSLTEASADRDGNIYVSNVAATDAPIYKYDSNLENPEELVTLTSGFSRDFQVSPDGNTIWWAGYTGPGVLEYSREDEFSSFPTVPDTVLRGYKVESFDLHPQTYHLWIGSGSLNDVPAEGIQPQTWYAFDYATLGSDETRMDSIQWAAGADISAGYDESRPRGLDFSADGQTAFVGVFNGLSTEFDVQKFTTEQVYTSNEDENKNEIPEGFSLEQNYPNPFNPTTNIEYTINQAGPVTLKVYDMTGREVATLVNARMSAGEHVVSFDASNLSSGVYIYSLQANGVRLTNKMTLIK